MIGWLIWSSSTHYIIIRRILFSKKLEFGKHSDWKLIDLIFHNSLHSLQEMIHSKKQQVSIWIVPWYMIDWFDLPQLTSFITGSKSFHYTDSLILDSIVMIGWLIGSSSIHYIQDRISIIREDNRIEFLKLINRWLINRFDLPQLITLSLEGFSSVRNFSISSMMIDNWLIWSS